MKARTIRHCPGAPIWALLVLAMLAACPGCKRATRPPQVIINGHPWYVDIARTMQEQATGLAGRKYLSPDVGMLFVLERPREVVFCMRGCDIPLDIAFISSDLRVVSVQTMVVEPDRAGRVPYPSGQPVQYALEVAGGGLARAGVKVGDRVELVATGEGN
jgi:hypothetical protein